MNESARSGTGSKIAFQLVAAISFTLSVSAHAQASAATSAATSAPETPTLIADSSSRALMAPDAPTPQAANQSGEHTDGQTKRILGIIPNFRAVNADAHLPPQTVKDKFVTATQDSFDYSSIVLPAAIAGFDLGRNSDPEFGGGGLGYARYLWHATVDQTVENYMVEFVVPAITHEDTRYYTMGQGGFLKRSKYALTRPFITRSDAGTEVFNYGEVVGSGAAAGISTLYYPSRERSFGNTGSQWGLNVGIDAATFVFKEFWPDINHALFHGQKPYHGTSPAP